MYIDYFYFILFICIFIVIVLVLLFFVFVCGAVLDRVNLSISFSFVNKQLLLLFLRSWYK